MRIVTARFLVLLLAVIALLAGAAVSPSALAVTSPAPSAAAGASTAPGGHGAGGPGQGAPASASGGCQPGGSGCGKLARPSREPVMLSPAAGHAPAATSLYAAWAWSGGDMLSSLSVAGGSTTAAAEAAAVGKCRAAGGGAAGDGPCVARVWFLAGYSAIAYGDNEAWGVSWDSTLAAAESDAVSYCAQYGTNCQLASVAVTPDTNSPTGAVIQPVPSYGVWAISPSAKLARWGVGGTKQRAQRVAALKCMQAGGVPAECLVYGAWVENGYSAIFRGANGTWSFSADDNPRGARDLAQNECRTVKAVGFKCTLKGTGATSDPWGGNYLGWIDQPTGTHSAKFTVSSTTGWQQAPIDLTAGDTYRVSYKSGKWTVDYRNFPRVGPRGYTNSVDSQIYQGCKYDPSRNYGVLLGQIGNSGQEFPIGAGGKFKARSTGSLYLRINDDDGCLGDNAGKVTMSISNDWAGSSFCHRHWRYAAKGARYIGITYKGVAACGNSVTVGNNQGPIYYSGVYFDSGGEPGTGFQCVELAARYFYYQTGENPPTSPTGALFVNSLHSKYRYNVSAVGKHNGKKAYRKSITPGNIISMWSAKDRKGHVAVITHVNVKMVNGKFNGTIIVMDENARGNPLHNGLGNDKIRVKDGKMFYYLKKGAYDEFQWTTNLPGSG